MRIFLTVNQGNATMVIANVVITIAVTTTKRQTNKGDSMLFLGIDGGGTKTNFILMNEYGETLGQETKGSASHWQVDLSTAKKVLIDGTEDVLRQAGKTWRDLTAVGYGMSGLGEDKEKDRRSIDLCHQIFSDIPIEIANDGEISLVATLQFRPGINVVAGTGSIAFGRGKDGAVGRCGGWGHEIGDEGSAYWLGCRVLELFTKQADGRREKTLLYSLVKDYFQLEYDYQIMTRIQDEYYGQRSKIASLQMLLKEAAHGGDVEAQKVYEKAAEELIELVEGLRHQLTFSGDIPVTYSGSVFKAGDFFVAPFRNGLISRGFKPESKLGEPLLGAVLMAAQKVNQHDILLTSLKYG
ncbi:MAG: nagk [Clostridia bacterium]|jgi:N-acetylglucosamine kinase-like BadF-type ATPase|nr:nagk [Clostridia bacterium]